jgi:hypothetical protein
MLILGLPAAAADTVNLVDLTVVRDALKHADISLEKAALYMDIDKSQLHRQLHGDGHLSVRRLARLPTAFWSWYGVLLCEHYGLPQEVQRATRLVVGLIGRRRMARMVRASRDRRRTA